jgi:hypothetical protein
LKAVCIRNEWIESAEISYIHHHKTTVGDMYEHFCILSKQSVYRRKIMDDCLTDHEVLELQKDIANGTFDADIPSFESFCSLLHEHDFSFFSGKIFHAPVKPVW